MYFYLLIDPSGCWLEFQIKHFALFWDLPYLPLALQPPPPVYHYLLQFSIIILPLSTSLPSLLHTRTTKRQISKRKTHMQKKKKQVHTNHTARDRYNKLNQSEKWTIPAPHKYYIQTHLRYSPTISLLSLTRTITVLQLTVSHTVSLYHSLSLTIIFVIAVQASLKPEKFWHVDWTYKVYSTSLIILVIYTLAWL